MFLKATGPPNELSLGAVRAQAGLILCPCSSFMAPALSHSPGMLDPKWAEGPDAGAMLRRVRSLRLAYLGSNGTSDRLVGPGRYFQDHPFGQFFAPRPHFHIRRACDAAVGVSVYGRRRQEQGRIYECIQC